MSRQTTQKQLITLSASLMLSLFMLLTPLLVKAKNIDLSTIPSRDSVQLTIYNSEDLTLVRETRQISIKKGRNQLQFSWANTRIDPTSVQLEFLSHPDDMLLTNTTFPHEKPQMLYWHINSEQEVLATVEISYFTSGITWQADYTAIITASGKTMSLDSYVTVTNNSGENYENARIRLVIGKINLVEQVNALVREADYKKQELQRLRRDKRMKIAKKMLSRNAGRYELALASPIVTADALEEEKMVAKDSLSEYYIFSIDGTESIIDGWAKKLRSSFAPAIQIEKVYRFRPREYGNILAGILIFSNNKEAFPVQAPLPEGDIQIYQKNAHNSLTYIAGLAMKYTPPGDKVELNTGADPDLYFELVNIRNWRDNIWMHYRKGNVYRRVGDGHLQVDHDSKVAGWNEHRAYIQHIRNHTDTPIKVEIRRQIPGDAQLKSQLQVKQHDFQTVDIYSELAAAEEQALSYEVVTRKGRNARQNRLKIN